MARGLSLARRIDAIDVPYFKARSGGITAKKSGEFMDLRRDREEEVALFTYLWGDVLTAAFALLTGGYNPEQRFKRMGQYGTVIPGSYVLPTSFNFYVGDDYILRLASDGANAYWPLLVRPKLGNEFPPSPTNAGKSISFFSTAKLEGGASVPEFQRAIALCASGWDGAGYGFCFGGLFRASATTTITKTGGPTPGATAAINVTQEYRVWAGRTSDFGVTPTVLAEAGRECWPARAQVGGPGVLLALQTTVEQLDTAAWVETNTPNPGDGYYLGTLKAFIKPKLWRSTDHGQSWAGTDAAFLDTYLMTVPSNNTGFNGPWETYVSQLNRQPHNNNQLVLIALGARFIYCGSNTVLLIVPNCWMGGSSPTEQMATLLFRSTDGGATFARIAWPADVWVSVGGIPATPRVTTFVGYAYHVHWSMGDGHAFVPTRHADGVRMLYTTDHGSTWNTSEVIPAAYIPPLTEACFPTVIAPDQCVIPSLDVVDRLLGFGRAGPTFDLVAAAGSIKVASDADPPDEDGIGYAGRTFAFVADGANKARRVHPGFPGAFDQP